MASQQKLIEFRKRKKNFGFQNEKVPVVDGYIYKKLLIIQNCPLCGNFMHTHGESRKTPKGYLTVRVRHCADRGDSLGNEYIIRISGDMTEHEYNRLSEKESNTVHGRDSVSFMDGSEYFEISEKRGTWV
jgi:hypothetical protein